MEIIKKLGLIIGSFIFGSFHIELQKLYIVGVLVLLASLVSFDVGVTQCASTHIALYLPVAGLRFPFLFSLLYPGAYNFY